MCLLMCAFPALYAGHQSTSLSALMYNDSITLGLSDNPDDLRSYGSEISFSHSSGWDVYSSLFGITYRDRGDDPSDEDGGRYDEFLLQGGYQFHFDISENDPEMILNITPFAGITFVGNLRLDVVQNFVHDFFSIERVSLDYDITEAIVTPHVGTKVVFTYAEPAPWFSRSQLVFRSESDVVHAVSFVSKASTSISVGQRTTSLYTIMLGLGYSWAHAYAGGETHERVTMSETGVTAFLQGHFGVFAFSYTWFLDRLQGFGGLGVSINFDDSQEWDGNDVQLSLGMIAPQAMTATSLRYTLVNDIGVSVTNMYKMIPLSDNGRRREIISLWLLNGDYEFSYWDFGWMRPFAQLGAGVKGYLIMKDAEDSSIDSNGRVREMSELRFVANANAGVRFFPDGRFEYQGVAYGLEVSFGVMFNDTTNLISELKLAERWLPYMKIGVTASMRL